MKPEKWLTSDDGDSLVRYVKSKASDRKVRLFACAACRRIWRRITEPVSRAAVEAAERFANGEIDAVELERAYRTARAYAQRQSNAEGQIAWATSETASRSKPAHGLEMVAMQEEVLLMRKGRDYDRAIQIRKQTYADMARCVFGNPFQPVTFEPAWRTSTTVAMAKGMYESRDFSAMPILADALQDAGCDNDDILNHCRDKKQVHVCGCWVIDLVLGKQ